MVSSPSLAEVERILDAIADPEIPVVSIRELGILRELQIDGDTVDVTLTPTYSGCPAIAQIEDDIRAALDAHRLKARIRTRLAPAWTSDWITEPARERLREYGIAPPQRCAESGTHVLRFATPPRRPDSVPCPQCGSLRTTETSHFGSTACKALYKCLDCLEPFDYFKPY
ncbi:MAG: 1,2-phenylacetyl-CoA epoxidase subunit PaaD [Burkholderiaceae bacterium]|nr:1,2-phenylacetyl-CoA epoxidase subunit PaaD [Burkholderiaceae bacterium]